MCEGRPSGWCWASASKQLGTAIAAATAGLTASLGGLDGSVTQACCQPEHFDIASSD